MNLSFVPQTLARHPPLAFPPAFAGGARTSFTPCIDPMIPITAAVVGGQGTVTRPGGRGRDVRWRAGVPTGSYVAGPVLSHAALWLLRPGMGKDLTGEAMGAGEDEHRRDWNETRGARARVTVGSRWRRPGTG